MSDPTPDDAELRDKVAEGIPRSLIDSPAVGLGTARRLKLADAMLVAVKRAGYVIADRGRVLPADARTRTEWTWRHNRFIAEHDASTDRARAERNVIAQSSSFPSDDVGVVQRTILTWPDELTHVGPWLPVPTTEEN